MSTDKKLDPAGMDPALRRHLAKKRDQLIEERTTFLSHVNAELGQMTGQIRNIEWVLEGCPDDPCDGSQPVNPTK